MSGCDHCWGGIPQVSKTRMAIRATSIGVTSFDFPESSGRFVTWVFTRNAAHCAALLLQGGGEGGGGGAAAVDGCTVVTEEHAARPCTQTLPHPDSYILRNSAGKRCPTKFARKMTKVEN